MPPKQKGTRSDTAVFSVGASKCDNHVQSNHDSAQTTNGTSKKGRNKGCKTLGIVPCSARVLATCSCARSDHDVQGYLVEKVIQYIKFRHSYSTEPEVATECTSRQDDRPA